MADAYSARITYRRRVVVVALHSQPAGGFEVGCGGMAARWDRVCVWVVLAGAVM
jgi:hypothetical protein